MSYSRDIALANILHALKVPRRDGRSLGDTQFRNMHAAYDELPADLKQRLAGRTATHDFAKFWDMMRARPGSRRGPLTPAQRAARSHPSSSRSSALIRSLAARYSTAIPAMRSASMTWTRKKAPRCWTILFRHQAQEKYFSCPQLDRGRRADVGGFLKAGNAIPIRVNIKGAKELILVTDFGSSYRWCVGADVNWCDARVVDTSFRFRFQVQTPEFLGSTWNRKRRKNHRFETEYRGERREGRISFALSYAASRVRKPESRSFLIIPVAISAGSRGAFGCHGCSWDEWCSHSSPRNRYRGSRWLDRGEPWPFRAFFSS